MGYWTKWLADGTEIRGEDSDVRRGLISWSRTLTRLVAAEINRGYTLKISGPGEYWQSDTFETSSVLSTPINTKTRIEKKIETTDIIYSFQVKTDGMHIKLWACPGWTTKTMPPGSIGKWIVMEYDLRTKFVRTYFSSEKI